jgi:hypothetical protein
MKKPVVNTKVEPKIKEDDNSQLDNEYDKTNKTLNDEISSKQRSMMYGKESIGQIVVQTDEDEYTYVDTDNYKKYLGLKKKKDFGSLLFLQLFWLAYFVLIAYFIYTDVMKKFMVMIFPAINDDSDPVANWGLLLAPICMYTIYKSFEVYSFSKNIF